MEVLQRHRLDQLREVELGQLVYDLGLGRLVAIRLLVDDRLDGHGPDFQDVTFGVGVMVVGGLGPVEEPAPRHGAREQRGHLLQAELELVAHRVLLRNTVESIRLIAANSCGQDSALGISASSAIRASLSDLHRSTSTTSPPSVNARTTKPCQSWLPISIHPDL